MSTTGRLTCGQPSPRLYPLFLRRPALDREAFIARMERVFTVIGSTGFPRDPDEITTLARESFDRDRDPRGPGRQLAAIPVAMPWTRVTGDCASAGCARAPRASATTPIEAKRRIV